MKTPYRFCSASVRSFSASGAFARPCARVCTRIYIWVLLLALAVAAPLRADETNAEPVLLAPALLAPTAHHVSTVNMAPRSRALFVQSMELNAALYQADSHLIRSPAHRPGEVLADTHTTDTHYWENCCSRTRETAFYALGLLMRDGAGDRAEAAKALNVVLVSQYTTPGERWFGTFRRTPEETPRATGAAMWLDYDPNWREFVGITLEMILVEYPERIPAELARRMEQAIERAVAGELAEKRLVPSYTNPALMFGALWDFAANQTHRADWQRQSGDWMEEVYTLFHEYGAFAEYNSPTYYGVDLLGISLWRDYGSTERIRQMGTNMELGLWNDVSMLYQPELHNLAGPYDRSYGMDTERFPSLLTLWMAPVFDEAHAPWPATVRLSATALSYVPQSVILLARIPTEERARLTAFMGEHSFRRQISRERVATAWVGKRVLIGAEATGKTRNVGKDAQFHPATVQWRTPDGSIGWIDLIAAPLLDATADAKGLTIEAAGTLRFRVKARGLTADRLTREQWLLPGLRVRVVSDAKGAFAVEKAEHSLNVYREAGPECLDVVYPEGTRLRLDVVNEPDQPRGK